VTTGLSDLKLSDSKKEKGGKKKNKKAPKDEEEDDEDDEDDEDEDDEGDGDEEDSEALEEVMKAMPPEVLARVLKLKGLDNERSELFTAYEAERCALEAKYRALYAPLYATRADVVNGRLDVPLPEELMDHAKVDGEKVRKLNK